MKKIMQEWNFVVTVNAFKRACDMLGVFGLVKRTDFYNIKRFPVI